MARPSRHLEALAVLQRYYAEHGILPTVEGLARDMGYRSTSSAFKALNHLVEEGYVSREPQGGRLLPGGRFRDGLTGSSRPRGLPELGGKTIDQYLRDADSALLVVATTALAAHGILKGDVLVVSKPRAPADGDLVVCRRGRSITVQRAREAHVAGAGTVLGTLKAQFRRY